MSRLCRGMGQGTVVVVAAILAACAAKRDEQPVVPQSAASSDTKPVPEAPVDVSMTDAAAQGNAHVVAPLPQYSVDTEKRSSTLARPAMEAQIAPAPSIACCVPAPHTQVTNTERYQHQDDNPVRLVAEHPVSTFSIDVDTGSYANVRRFINDGQLPPQDAVRVEEMINYFEYEYAPPRERSTPFKVATELAAAPWNPNAWLLKVGIKGFEIDAAERPAANLVFLIDVSGSMQSPDKLPLLKNAFHLLTQQLTAKDRVAIVVYAGSSGVVLEPTPGDQKAKIRDAIDRLEAGGSTNGAEGIERAYQLARAGMIDKGINRVVLATDGDFNVGVVSFEALIDMAERERASGVALTTLGFGTGNYNDHLLERLADAGNGNYAYVDSLQEARKVLVTQLNATLYTIAKDVKIQIEFNPAHVLEYRLIGYENRMLAREDFSNDKVDAGDIGAGHRVTALYEIVPRGARGRVEPLRYGSERVAPSTGPASSEIAHVRLRYKQPEGATSSLLEFPVLKGDLRRPEQASADLRFAASVAAFGQLLRGGKYIGEFGYDDIVSLAQGALGADSEGFRREFVSLVKLAQAVAGPPQAQLGRASQAE